MLRVTLIALAGIVLALPFGCGKGQEDEAPGEGESTAERIEEEAEDTKEEVKGWAADAKEDVVEFAQKQIKAIREDVNALGEKAAERGEEARQKWNDDLKPRLERQFDRAQEELSELKESGGETWEDVKAEVREAVSRLKDAYEAAKKELQNDEDGS